MTLPILRIPLHTLGGLMSISRVSPLFLLECFFCNSFEFEIPFEALAFFMAGLASSLHSLLVLFNISRPNPSNEWSLDHLFVHSQGFWKSRITISYESVQPGSVSMMYFIFALLDSIWRDTCIGLGHLVTVSDEVLKACFVTDALGSSGFSVGISLFKCGKPPMFGREVE